MHQSNKVLVGVSLTFFVAILIVLSGDVAWTSTIDERLKRVESRKIIVTESKDPPEKEESPPHSVRFRVTDYHEVYKNISSIVLTAQVHIESGNSLIELGNLDFDKIIMYTLCCESPDAMTCNRFPTELRKENGITFLSTTRSDSLLERCILSILVNDSD